MDKGYEIAMVCATAGGVLVALIVGIVNIHRTNKEFKRDMARHEEKMKELEGQTKSLKGQHINKFLDSLCTFIGASMGSFRK